MVKFKFPGKPSKIKQRSLVSAYSVVVPSCDTSSVSEDLCFGLSLFESTFGEDDEGESFKGFTDEEISEAELKKKAREKYFNDEMMLRGLLLPVVPLTKIIVKDDHNIKDSNDRKSVSSIVKKSVKENVSKQKERMKSNKRWLLNKRILNRYHPKLQIRHNFKTLNKNSLMRFKHKTLSANYLSDRYCRKFILPSRSLHSSRVIKPNKRFMDHERSTKFKNTRLNVPPDRQEDVEYDPDILNSNINTGGKHTKAETSSNKVIIREARLNITTETTITGPFSAKKFVSLDKESRSGVITCGICGSVRFYKYVLQTRKFGIYSCEPCRRFILKMIKYSKQPQFEILNCNAENGVGNCVILPVASNRKKDSSDDSFAKNFRCEACLLSLCLQKYIMPASIKKSLIQLIPDDVKLNFFNGLSPEFKKSLPILDRSLNALHKTVSNEENHDKLRKRLNVHNYLKNARCSKRMLEKYDISAAKSKSFLHKRSNLHQRGSVKSKFTQESTRKDNYPEKDHYVPRGPRIKHVCRSASSVLKTSTTDKDFEDPPCNLSEADCAKNSRKNSDAKMVEKPTQMTKIRQCDDSIPTSVELGNDPDSIAKTIAQYRARTLQDFCRHSSDESDENEDKLISTDFWEAYDPDEVYKTGFPLISSEWLNVRALCFLCGSAGIEKLLYCVSCCEPYHWYCAEGPSAFREESELEKCRVNWVCRKCKVCSTCGERDSRTLISCQRCKNSYHDDCLTNKALNKRLFKSDRPWVCPSCLKCKSCNSNTVFTYVGNIPLCSLCFKLRQKGSFCPLCQRCYQDDDYNVKMMECGICEKWIHAKCEGLSHEKYQILSFLPDTIEFVCRLCCNVPPAQWWLAVEDELKAGYLGILKCLCKNKKISDLFKESPRKDTCRCVKFKKLPCPADAYDSDSGMEVDADSKSSSPKHADTEDAKICDTGDPESSYERCSYCCYNSETRNKINNDLLCIKAKVHNNQYGSLLNFHQELENVIREVEELDLIKTYRESLKKFFPWFDPECPRGDDHNEFHMPDIPVNENHPTVVDSSQREEAAEEEYQTLRSLMDTDDYDYENFKMLDLRKCNLCKGTGEAIPSEGGRLIYCGRNEWVHSNCALWSSEVFEEIDGSLQNVHSAISRGRQIRCNVCDKKGASVGCCYKNCAQTYHLMCAKKARCIFLQNRTIYCRNHDTDEVTLPFLNCEKDFEILRPVYIETDRKKKKLECHSNVKLRIGSLHVESLGKIDPHLSDNPKYILPIYFRCTRLFWSTTKPWKIIQYHIQIKLRYCSQDVKSDSEVNYTVDHSTVKGVERDQQIVKQVVANMVNKVSAKEDYANDLLLPELQEAIYKDLPNDLLNDKTLQDIWNNYDGITDLECSTERSASKKPANRITPKLDKCKKSSDLVAKPNDHMDGKKCAEDNKTGAKINGKYLRDKNDLKEDAAKKTPNALDDFYSELCNKVKRKINFENSAIAKKKIFDANFIGAEKLVGVDFYAEPDRAYKPPYVQTYENILQLDGMVDIHAEEEPVKCIKCHCTYRTTTSFERHLEMCNSDFGDYMISSCESDASSEEEKFNTCTKSVRYENTDVKYDSMTVEDHKPAISTNPPVFQGNVCGNTAEDAVYTFSTVQDDMQNGAMLQAFVQNVKQEPICMPEQANNIQDAVKLNLMNGKIKTEVICNDYATIGGASSNQQYTLNNVAAPVATQSYQIQNMAPTYVIQSFPKQEVIPTYVAVDNTIAECIQPQPQLQLQQLTAMNQQPVNYQPAVIPTILGTAVMQPSVIETPTYYINTPQSGELFAPQNNIILPNQPMLFGMETVVSNTVMSSSQFMTQSLTGNVGSSTMYSTTTTQIFQAAKQMPQTIQPGYIVVNSPIQQHVPQVQHTAVKAPQAYTAISTPGSEKYMYVQVNHQPNVTVNSTAPKPVITKATRNTQSTPRNKPLKVMKVRNNKPTTIHTPQAKSSNDHKVYPTSYVRPNGTAKMMHLNGTCVNEIKEFLNIDSTPKPVQAPNTKFHLTGTALKPMIGETRPPPVTKYAKVDKCVNTDSKGSLHNVPSSGTTNEQTIQISYTIDGENLKCPGPVIKSWNLNIPVEGENSTQTNRTPVQQNPPQSKCPPKPIILRGTPPAPKHTPVIPKAAQPVQPKPSPKPQLRPEIKYAKAPPVRELSPPPICCNDMPDLDFLLPPPRPKPINGEKIEIKSDSEKLFDELLRQHMLSMENAGTPEPEYRKSPENSTVRNVPKTSKSKYKPQTNVKKSPTEHDARTNGKRKIDLEKENFDKLRSLISEAENTKNWKTASISFEVNAEDGFSYKTNNLTDLWNKIIESVQKSRAKYKLPLLPKNALVNGDSVYSLLGFENNASKYLLEQLPDAWKCIFYKPVFHKSPLQSSKTSPSKNESGCARTEPFNSSHKYDMFGWLASRHRKPPKFMMISDSDIVNGNRRITSLNLPMAMRFRHLKETAKETVGVFRSDIHGRGLFCLRDIDPGEMVIEYAGEVIRSTLTDKREKYYTSKGIGCYMFRIDDKYVVDATMCGNAARFINHSCEPNCYSRIVDILGKKHILIFALRKIPKGEELTYDYKFPLEDDKIYCHCLSRKCRKYLN